MKNLFNFKWFIALLALATTFAACEDDDNDSKGIYDNGILISNEGAFGAGNGSLSYYSYKDDTITNDIFRKTNGRQLGDVVQDIKRHDNKVFIVVNASDKVEVANAYTMEQMAAITNLTKPRYAEVTNNKLYVSQWGNDGQVVVLNEDTYENIKTINVGVGAEGIIAHNNKVYVANSGGNGYDNTLSIIDATSDKVVKTLEVGDCPKNMVIDKNNKIWVLCAGHVTYNPDYSAASQTPSKLIQIDPDTDEIIKTFTFAKTFHPGRIAIDKDGKTIYYGGDYGVHGIFAIDITATTAPSTPFIDINAYGFGTDEKNEVIYVGVAPSFTVAGKLIRYDYQGNKIEEYTVGIGPNGVANEDNTLL